MLAKQNVNRSKIPPSQVCPHGPSHVWVSDHSTGERRNTTFFIDAHQGEHTRTIPGKEPLIKVQSLMKTQVTETVPGDPSHPPALPSCPSAHTTCSPLLQTQRSLELVPIPTRVLQQHDQARTQEDEHPPSRDFIPFVLPFISVLRGQNGSKPSCRPRDDRNGGFLLTWLRSHKLKLIHRLFALSIQKYSIKPSGTS